MSALKISIIIPSYNPVEFIEETIQSVLNQNYSNFECVVIDGGSNDGTLDILKRYEGRIRWISAKDEGQSDAINKGLRLASGDILAYICADDIYEAGCFQKVADFFGKNPHVMWAYGKCKVINEDGSEIHRPIISYFDSWRRRYSYNRLLMIDFIPQPAVFWRKELIHKIGLFDINEHLAMDYEYWLRAGARYDPGFIDDYLASFRVHPRSKSSMNRLRQAKQALYIATRYANSPKRRFLVVLQCVAHLSFIFISRLVSRLRIKRRKPMR
jgi:glycosyltransferase involved in cell wall biosynthesis